jgi:hypothetical protein
LSTKVVGIPEEGKAMSDNGLANTIPDTTPLYRLIATTRSLLRSSWVATGLGLSVGLWFAALIAVSLADLVVPLWPALRLSGLLLVVVPASWAFFVGVVRPAFRRLGPTRVARRIESHIPGIHNRLVSCIELAQNQGQKTGSPAFYRRLVQEALDRIRGFRARTVIDLLSLRRAGVFAFASVSGFAIAFVLFSDRLPTAMARIFLPFADIPPASGVMFKAIPDGDAKVLRGEDLVFTVDVEKGQPKDFQVKLTSPTADKPIIHDLKKLEGNRWQVAVNSASLGTGFDHTFQYRIYGGGTWTKLYQVTVLDRPAIVSLHTVLHYPEYMAIPDRVNPPQTADVTGPEKSQVEVVVQAEGDVAEGEIQFLEPRIGRIEPNRQIERVWFEEQIPGGAKADFNWQLVEKQQRTAHTMPAEVEIDQFGYSHSFQVAPVAFQVQRGDHLFTYVYLPQESKPQAIMLQWHDGTTWEHRAYWGADKIKLGKPDTASRRHIGPLPAAGQWARLEVPAEAVDLQGKSLRGMSFTLSGGQCFWSRSGAVRMEEQIMVPVQRFAMKPGEGNLWSGTFPLHGTGLYRAELRNELGHANKPMKEAKFVAIMDQPPQIVLEQPGADVTLTSPTKVPLVVRAFDDFGLADISLQIQLGEGAAWETRLIKQYLQPRPSDTVVTTLDLPAMKLKMGETLRYHALARDRNGQTAKTQDFVVRIAADPYAADKQLAEFEKSEDPFRQKLVNLIAQQAKVREQIEKLAVQYAPVSEKIKTAEALAKIDEAAKSSNTQPSPPAAQPKPLKLDPETEKMLQALRKEMAELAKLEDSNLQLGKQMEADLSKIVEQANKLQMLPKDIADQLRAIQGLFQQRAVHPLQDLTNSMKQGADPKQGSPDLAAMNQTSDRLQKELEAMRDRLKAVDDAQKEMRDDAKDALTRLQNEMQRQQGALTERDLEELKNFIAALRDELNREKGEQGDLQKSTESAKNSELAEMEKKQAALDMKENETLEKTRELQASERMKRMKRRPDFPRRPYDPDTDEQLQRPKEVDPDDPDAMKKALNQEPTATAAKKDKGEDEEDENFMPALGGPKPKLDPRFAGKQRPLKKAPKDGIRSPTEQREDLQDRQQEQMNDLEKADQSLASDQKSLEQMTNQLRQALQKGSAKGDKSGEKQGSDSPQDAGDLAQMLKSQALQQALDMANRMRGMRSASRRGGKASLQMQNAATTGNLQGTPPPGFPLEGELGNLDLKSRAAILKMQPKLREELLQSMREKGPEGYQEFIDDYFKRLSQGKTPK